MTTNYIETRQTDGTIVRRYPVKFEMEAKQYHLSQLDAGKSAQMIQNNRTSHFEVITKPDDVKK